MYENAKRAEIVSEALSWLGTPHVNMARVKGAGVDCGQILAAVYEAVGLIPSYDPGQYPSDWHLHRDDSRYLEAVELYAKKINSNPKPGDIVLYKYGRCIAHGAIVIQWPTILHAYVNKGVILDDAEANRELVSRQMGFWSVFPGHEGDDK